MQQCESETETFSTSPKCQKCNDEDATECECGEIEIPLPDELLAEIIFKYVPLYRWSSCLEHVSRQFQHCVLVAYKRVKSVNIRTLLPLKLNEEIFKNSAFFAAKKFRTSSVDWLNEILEKLWLVCPFLMELKGFNRVAENMTVTHLNILSKFQCLQSIEFYGLFMPPSSLALISTSLKTVRDFRMVMCYVVDSGQFDIATTKMEKIVVDYGGCSPATTKEMELVEKVELNKLVEFDEIFCLKNYGENLTTLELNNLITVFHTLENADQVVKKCPNLQSLTAGLDAGDGIDIFLEVLPNLHKLTHLELLMDHNFYPHRYISDLCVSMTSLANRLESFGLEDWEDKNDSSELQKFLFTRCLHLRCLKLVIYGMQCLDELPRLSGTLETLEIYIKCSGCLPKILQLSNLTELNITASGTEPWQDLYFLEKLRHLRLPGEYITDAILQRWDTKGNGMFEKLITLEMNGCRHVSDVGGCLLAKKGVKLEFLDLTRSRITDLTIFTLAATAKKLKIVRFPQYEQCLIGKEAMLHLIEKSVYLKKLHVSKALAMQLAECKEFLPFVNDVEFVFWGRCSVGDFLYQFIR